MKKIRVLHILDELNTGGAERIVVSYFQHIDREKFQWDFVITRYEDPNKRGQLEDVVEKLGGHIFRVPRKREGYLKNIKATAEIIKNGNYDIVHSHLDELSAPYLLAAKRYHVPVRICHSHLVGADRGKSVELLCKFYKPILNSVVTDRFACGEDAGRALWGSKPFFVMKNAIETEDFKFNQSKRDELRKKYKCEDKIVLGSVGRLSYQKNSEFLIDIFAEYHKKNPKSELWVIGEGPLEASVNGRIEKYELDEHVKMFGGRNDVNELLNAMDVFLLPSRFEGLPIVLVEAQCNGLPCVVSDTVTKEVDLGKIIRFFLLSKGPLKWAELIDSTRSSEIREIEYEYVSNAGYDISKATNLLEKYYIKRYSEEHAIE